MHMGFCPIFVRLIMSYISSVSYSFDLKGVKVGYIKSSRSPRQGNPLSPYLFLICAEELSYLINKKIDQKMITGIKVYQKSPQISHLFFVDDSLTKSFVFWPKADLIWIKVKNEAKVVKFQNYP